MKVFPLFSSSNSAVLQKLDGQSVETIHRIWRQSQLLSIQVGKKKKWTPNTSYSNFNHLSTDIPAQQVIDLSEEMALLQEQGYSSIWNVLLDTVHRIVSLSFGSATLFICPPPPKQYTHYSKTFSNSKGSKTENQILKIFQAWMLKEKIQNFRGIWINLLIWFFLSSAAFEVRVRPVFIQMFKNVFFSPQF